MWCSRGLTRALLDTWKSDQRLVEGHSYQISGMWAVARGRGVSLRPAIGTGTGIWSTKAMETSFNKHKCNIYCKLLNLKDFIPKCCLSQYYTRCSVSLCYKDNKIPFSCIQILWRQSGGYVTLSSYLKFLYYVSIISIILVILRIVHKCVLSVKSKQIVFVVVVVVQ